MNYISKQFAGPNIQGFSDAIEDSFNTLYVPTLDYFSTLSIASANEAHTEMIGRLIGFPRPLVNAEIMNASLFKFSFSYYKDSDIGFSLNYDALGTGGRLTEVDINNNLVYLALPAYKALLKIIAEAKNSSGRNSIVLIDSICSYFSAVKNYKIEWVGTHQGILITFYDISVYTLYLIGYVLNYLFDSEPDITVIKETT